MRVPWRTVRWIEPLAPEIELLGLVGDRRDLLHRLPDELRTTLPVDTWQRSLLASGVRVRFRTDSSRLRVRLEYLDITRAPSAFDVYIDGDYWDSFGGDAIGACEALIYDPMPGEHEIELVMPPYAEVRFGGLGIEEDADLSAPAAMSRPMLVFHGDSITHGAHTRRAGLTYPQRVARALGTEFINLGVSGTARGEPGMAAVIARLDADAIVLAYGVNTFGSAFEGPRNFGETYRKFLGIVRGAHPKTPILIVTPLFHSRELVETNALGAQLEEYRRVIRQIVWERQSFGDGNLILIEGFGIIGPGDDDRLADHVHPNDQGFAVFADRLIGPLRRLLRAR
jgi:lysophospholipase L1-like esterase